MIVAVELTVSEICRGQNRQRSEESGHSDIDYNSLKCNLGLCILLLLNVY